MVGESESSSLGVNESYIQSDIADIIHKMYSPHLEMDENSLSDGRINVVEDRFSSNREIHWRENKRTDKRFGHYFETKTKNHLRTVLDSSSSGSVSLPGVRHKPIRSGTYACRCCRRKISNRLQNKKVSSTCGHCRICTKTLPSQANIRANCVSQDSDDFSSQRELLIIKSEQIRPKQPEKKVSAVINEKHKAKEENIQDTKIVMDHSSNLDRTIIIREPEITSNINQSKTLLSRVFSSLIGSFDKNIKSQAGIKVYNNVDDVRSQTHTQEVKVNQLELDVRQSKLSVQKQKSSKSLTSGKQNKRRGCRNLAENPDEINSMLSDDCKINLHLELISSGEDKSKLSTAYSEQSSQQCLELLHESSSDSARVPVVKSMVCMSKSGELFVGDEPVSGEQISKAQLQPNTKIPNYVCAETCRLDLGEPQLSRTTTAAAVLAADRREEWAVQFWARVFGHGHLVLAFLTAFALQLFSFVLQGLVRPLVWGSLQLACDHCIKPFLAVLFDGLLQPVLRLLQNIACSARDVARPLAEAVGLFVGELARLLSACRLVEVHAPARKVS